MSIDTDKVVPRLTLTVSIYLSITELNSCYALSTLTRGNEHRYR